jgi:UDP-glucose 4-epimerase
MSNSGSSEHNGARPAAVAVTGACGLLGRAVVADLAANGLRVRAVDRVERKKRDAEPVRVDTVVVDLRDPQEARRALAGADTVVHLAAWPTPHAAPERVVWSENVDIATNVAFAAAEAGVRRFVYASSQSVLGLAWAKTVVAPDYLPVDEDHPCRPSDAYSASKIAGEHLVASLARGGRFDAVALRFPVIWERGQFGACVSYRLDNPQQGAKSQWAYVDARDAARAVRLALASASAGYFVLNVAAPRVFAEEPVPVLVRRWYDAPAEVAEVLDPSEAVFSGKRAESVLGFSARYLWSPEGISESPVASSPELAHRPGGRRAG